MKLSVIVMLSLLMAGSAYANCSFSHCSKKSDILNKKCIKAGQAGKDVFFEDNDGNYCSCPCSCFADSTLLSVADGAMSVADIQRGDEARTQSGKRPITFALSSEVNGDTALKFVMDSGNSITVSENHPMISADYRVIEASDVRTGMELAASDGSADRVQSITPVKYTGKYYNFVVTADLDNGEDRIINANGLQSGDWMVQSYRDYLDSNVELREVIKAIKNN